MDKQGHEMMPTVKVVTEACTNKQGSLTSETVQTVQIRSGYSVEENCVHVA